MGPAFAPHLVEQVGALPGAAFVGIELGTGRDLEESHGIRVSNRSSEPHINRFENERDAFPPNERVSGRRPTELMTKMPHPVDTALVFFLNFRWCREIQKCAPIQRIGLINIANISQKPS